ncbi:Unknown protein sequence [Pseudomonas syringae pv. spinaceae]|uniref:Uncharacterized protein n=1 Tax=Pseudomonas syringae pv. spinaceae TaxID=264459 RepID=A0A0P9ZCM7_PSESX|nr:Unknown protein sequence [Pseudomonas syringae pv. spinaceae]
MYEKSASEGQARQKQVRNGRGRVRLYGLWMSIPIGLALEPVFNAASPSAATFRTKPGSEETMDDQGQLIG